MCATTIPSNSPASLCIASTSMPSMVSRSANSSGNQSNSTCRLSQFSVAFIVAEAERSRRPGGEVSFLTRPENLRDHRGGLREGATIILPQQRGDRGGDLTLRDRFRTRAFSERGGVGAEHGNPDAFGAFDLRAMIDPR